jgi:hypothetical protein
MAPCRTTVVAISQLFCLIRTKITNTQSTQFSEWNSGMAILEWLFWNGYSGI